MTVSRGPAVRDLAETLERETVEILPQFDDLLGEEGKWG